jgi:hypothetical protein
MLVLKLLSVCWDLMAAGSAKDAKSIIMRSTLRIKLNTGFLDSNAEILATLARWRPLEVLITIAVSMHGAALFELL